MPEIRTDIKKTLQEVNRTLAELCRATDINYKRLSGGVNGYWNFRPKEEFKIKQILATWMDDKQEVCGY